MEKPLASKYLILVPTVLNIAIFYMLVQPLRWVQVMLTPAWQAILMCCGVAMTAMMALAYVRLHQQIEESDQAGPSKDRQSVSDAQRPATTTEGTYEPSESAEKAKV
jgi:hypothetical protein